MYLTGADFLSACIRPEVEWISFCNGYVQAVFDGFSRSGEKFCLPAGTARASVVDNIVNHLETNPNLQSARAANVVYAYLVVTYPCP